MQSHRWPRLCQHRRPADDHGPALRQQGRLFAVRRADRRDTGIAYKTSAEMAAELGTFPWLQEERPAHAARDPQPPPRRPRPHLGL